VVESNAPRSIHSFLRRPLVLIVLAGLAIRFALMPLLTYDYDMYHWAVIFENIKSGNNLYDLTGYFYTPVWGYMMGAIYAFSDLFLSVDSLGSTFTNMLPIEVLAHRFHIATITTVQFNMLMKVPLVICDIVVGYIIYKLILGRTQDRKKATYGFGLWFLCPIVIYMSAVQAMFDTISALLLLLTVFMLYKDKCFIAGALFSVAFLLKFFPVFCIFVLIGYVCVRHRDDGLIKRKVISMALGGLIMTVILMLPQIINGQMDDALLFITGRASASDRYSSIFTLLGVAFAGFGMLYFGHRMFKTKKENADKALFENIFFAMTCAVLMSITPQYVIVLIPFLIIHIMTTDFNYRKCWIIISIGAFGGALILNNFSLLCSIAEYTTLVSPEWIVSSMQALEGTIFGVTYVNIINVFFNLMQYAGLVLIVAFHFLESISSKFPKLGMAISKFKNAGVRKSEV
jgi:Predicted integral membrane protein